MSEPDDDRDLEAFLSSQHPVSQAWREARAPDRAPAGLDAVILEAAADAAAAPVPTVRSGIRRRRRWPLPIGLAASLLVGIGVLRELEGDPAARRLAQPLAAAVVTDGDAADGLVEESASAEPPPPSTRPLPASPLSPPSFVDLPPPAETVPPPPREPATRRPAAAAMADAGLPPPASPEAMPAPMAASEPLDAVAVEELLRHQQAMEMTQRQKRFDTDDERAAAVEAKAKAEAVQRLERERAASKATRSAASPARAAAGAYQGLAFGDTGVDEAIARFGPPAARRDDGEAGSIELDYRRGLDPRGRLRLHFTGTPARLEAATVTLEPPLALPDVRRDESLIAGPGCTDGRDEPLDPAEAGTLRWPSRGIALRLGEDGLVESIVYRATCTAP